MSVVTLELSCFTNILGLCLVNWNPFYPVLIDFIITCYISPIEEWKTVLFPSIAAGLWALLIFRRNKQVYSQVESNANVFDYIFKSVWYITKDTLAIAIVHELFKKIPHFPIPPATAFVLIMSYTFYSSDLTLRQARWDWYTCIVLGYNFAFSVWAKFHNDVFPTTEVQILCLMAPPLISLVYMDIFK